VRCSKIVGKTFKEAFCERYGYASEAYEGAVFRRCVFRHAWILAVLICWVAPETFQEDFDLIREVGQLSDPDLIRREVNYFYGRNARDKSWIRTTLLVRVSGKRLLRLRGKVARHALTGSHAGF
jgi:hypothetical protein